MSKLQQYWVGSYSIHRHRGIRGAADEAMLNKVLKIYWTVLLAEKLAPLSPLQVPSDIRTEPCRLYVYDDFPPGSFIWKNVVTYLAGKIEREGAARGVRVDLMLRPQIVQEFPIIIDRNLKELSH
jgi:hypothetical protein